MSLIMCYDMCLTHSSSRDEIQLHCPLARSAPKCTDECRIFLTDKNSSLTLSSEHATKSRFIGKRARNIVITIVYICYKQSKRWKRSWKL